MQDKGPRLHPRIRGRHGRHRREAAGARRVRRSTVTQRPSSGGWTRRLAAIDDEAKKDALKRLFSQSRVALIYGAAGTGKSTMVDHIANYFNDKPKLFLAHTNPAIDNLKRRVTAPGLDVPDDQQPDPPDAPRIRSTTSWSSMSAARSATPTSLKVLEKTSFKLLVLVGDVYQIESIQFGNWFGIIRSFIPAHLGVRTHHAIPDHEPVPCWASGTRSGTSTTTSPRSSPATATRPCSTSPCSRPSGRTRSSCA